MSKYSHNSMYVYSSTHTQPRTFLMNDATSSRLYRFLCKDSKFLITLSEYVTSVMSDSKFNLIRRNLFIVGIHALQITPQQSKFLFWGCSSVYVLHIISHCISSTYTILNDGPNQSLEPSPVHLKGKLSITC
jgi:hypothetical protein